MFQLSLLHLLDWVSTIGFAASGAVLAREQHRSLGISVAYAVLTAVGGGTLRDLLLGQPIFWVASPEYVLFAISTGTVVALLFDVAHLTRRQFGWLDNVGLATFTVIGTQAGLLQTVGLATLGLSPLMGLMTAVGGGCLRDLLSQRRPITLRHPRYWVASWIGGTVFSVLQVAHIMPCCAMVVAIALTLLLLPNSVRALVSLVSHGLGMPVSRRGLRHKGLQR
ncbi:MAG: TRIC cation channel family protein [Cyanobacteria bacterium J06632_22]